jgi:hypothetical protein
MTHPLRSILILAVLALGLAACAQTAEDSTSDAPEPSQPAAPSEAPGDSPQLPSEEPSAAPSADAREIAGTITVAEMAFSGPGATVQEAIDAGPAGDLPSLVRGVLFRDTDGRIFLATAVGDTTVPTFDGPMLEVLEMESDGPSWDMTNAETLGLQEANGIVFNPDAQVLGFIELP